MQVCKERKAVYNGRMKKIHFCVAVVLVNIAFSSLFAEDFSISDAEPLAPQMQIDAVPDDPDFFKLESEKKLVERKDSSLTIKSNVTGAHVYLNGNYQGTTPLTIQNLTQGRYHLRIDKDHYETRELYVTVRTAQERIYYIDLERITGRLSFTVTPADADILVDSITVHENPMTLDEGTHSVTVRRFGYKTETATIEVFRHALRRVTVELDEAPFAITSIKSSKPSFNPQNAGSLGTNEIQFSVSAPGAGTLTVTDTNGTQLFVNTYTQFTTWNYTATWNGKTTEGFPVPDGVYIATLNAQGLSASCSFNVDSSISYPQLSITSDGTGLGSVASAQMYPGDTMIFHFALGPAISLLNKNFYGAPFTAQFGWAITKWCEASIGYSIMLGKLQAPCGNITMKFGSSIPLAGGTFCYALNLRAGISKDAIYAPYGVDFGTGLGTGCMLGFDTGNLYAGLSSEFIYGPVNGVTANGTDIGWKNGLILQVRNNITSLGLYAALNSCFGSYSFTKEKSPVVYSGNVSGIYRALDTGIEGSLYFLNSSVSSSYKIGTIWYPEQESVTADQTSLYLYGAFGITIVF